MREVIDGDASRVIMGGDSAGGGLAVALCVALKDEPEALPRAPLLASVQGAGSVEGILAKQYTERYGEPSLPLPESLLESPLVMALRLSPQYMPEGINTWTARVSNGYVFTGDMARGMEVLRLA